MKFAIFLWDSIVQVIVYIVTTFQIPSSGTGKKPTGYVPYIANPNSKKILLHFDLAPNRPRVGGGGVRSDERPLVHSSPTDDITYDVTDNVKENEVICIHL